MINIRNKTVRFFSASVILSALIHITFLMALPLIKGFLFVIPFTPDVITIHLEDGTESDITSVKASGSSMQKKDKSVERIVSKENLETGGENQNNDGSAQMQIDSSVINTTEESGKQPEKKAVVVSANEGTGPGEVEAQGKPLQMAQPARERFYYDIYWLGIQVGNASLEAIGSNGVLKITSRANSSGFISTFYKVDDYAESLIMHGTPSHFRIKQHEGKYKSDKETIFNAVDKNVSFFNYLKGTKDEHSVQDGIAWDIISGFYYLRTQPLEIGKTICINIFDSNKFYKAEIDVLRREKIGIPGIGEVNAIIVKPQLKTNGLFQRKGDVLIWITDDEKRMPVRIETKVPIGDVVAKLRDFALEK